MAWEFQLLDTIQKWHTPVGDVLMKFFTSLGNAGIIWIVLAAVLLLIPKTRKAGMILAAALIMDLLICNLAIKPVVARIRPFDVNTAVHLLVAKPKDYSFPSGHTAASFASAAALYFAGMKKLWKGTAVLGVIIAFSRLYLYVHYPTDVLGGMLIGILCGYLGYIIVKKLSSKFVKNAQSDGNN